jgi:hypothetical protein
LQSQKEEEVDSLEAFMSNVKPEPPKETKTQVNSLEAIPKIQI